MAKKPSPRPKKKSTRAAGTGAKAKRSAGSAAKTGRSASASRRKRELEEKYNQSGAPWWKKHLPE